MAKLFRVWRNDYATLGILILDNSNVIKTLEPAWRDNAAGASCIPAGEYDAIHMRVSSSGRYSNIYHIQKVPGRFGILIHAGNFASHTRGCILPGMAHGGTYKKPAAWSSNTALNLIRECYEERPFKLEVIEC